MNEKDEKYFQETLEWFRAEREDEARFYFIKACEYKQKEIEKFIKDHPPELTEEQYNKLIKDWADDLIKKLEGEK